MSRPLIRAILGYELGQVDPLIYLDSDKLDSHARQTSKRSRSETNHQVWMNTYDKVLSRASKNKGYAMLDFVQHHKKNYGNQLPIWVAVEIMDWGMLRSLYTMSPMYVQSRISERCNLEPPQLSSWLGALNHVRSFADHHARMYNRIVSDPNFLTIQD